MDLQKLEPYILNLAITEKHDLITSSGTGKAKASNFS
jgi:hypothetical protein